MNNVQVVYTCITYVGMSVDVCHLYVQCIHVVAKLLSHVWGIVMVTIMPVHVSMCPDTASCSDHSDQFSGWSSIGSP